jgi:hypothetical protein
MSIIYSYPEQGALNADDLLIGTSATKVGGKQKNITRNFSIQQIADFINRGTGFVDPVATDFQIPVFNQQGKKITGSIMSQDTFPNGTGITITGSLTTTGNISTSGNLTAPGNVILGGGGSSVSLLGTIALGGPIIDSSGTTGSINQILISSGTGAVNWQNYEAGLTYEGTWDALNNTTNGLSNSPALVSGIGVSGHFYIVNAEGTTSLGPGLDDWHIGDWAIFLDEGGQPASWQKIDNTSTLVGSGTAGTLSKWTTPTTLNDSLVSEAGTVVSVNGILKVNDTVESTVTNSNLKLQGNGTGAVEVRGFGGVTGTAGRIQLNCSNNNHGVSIESPPHTANATYTLILPTSFGGPGDVLTSAGTNPSQLVWTTPTTGAVTGTGTTNTLPIWTNGGAGELGDSILDQLSAAGVFTDTHLSVAGSGGLSTQNLEINKALYDGAASSGTDGFVLTSATSGTDKVISWVDPTTIGDSYDLRTTTVGGNVELSLVSGSATDNSAVIVTGAGGITVAETQGANPTDPTTLTLTGTPGGVTSVGTADANLITIAGTGSGPYTGAVTATANTAAVAIGSNNLATGDQIQTAIDTALAGTLTFKGTFNAATGSITSGVNNGLQLYSGTAGVIAITQGDFYIADTAGSFYNTTAMNVGDEAIALFTVAAAPPGSAITDWSVVPSAGAGVVSVLPSSTGLASSGQPLVITPAGGTGTVTIESTAYAGQSNVGHVPAGGIGGQYLDGDAGSWLTLPSSGVTSVSQGTPFTSTGLPLLISPASGSVVVSSAVYGGGSNIGVVPDGGTSADFLKGDGTWGSAGGGASTITTNNFPGNGTVGPFALGATPSGGSKSFVDVFIDGVYQEITTYSVTGTALTFVTAVPSGVTIETKTTSGNVSGALVSSVDIGQSNTTGNVDLRIVPLEVTSGQTIPGNANYLYIFTATGAQSIATVTLPGSPTLGDSIKISNLGGLANVLGANGNKIMGQAADMTINTPTAAFELIWSGSNNGWIIIGNV